GRVDLAEHLERSLGARALPLGWCGEAARRMHAAGREPVGEAHQHRVLLPEQQLEREPGEPLLVRQGTHAANRSSTSRATACWAAWRSSFLMTRAPRTQGNTVRYASHRLRRYSTG